LVVHIKTKLERPFQFLPKEITINTLKTKCDFASHETLITKGEMIAMQGWWKAGDECRKHFTKANGTPNRSAYAIAAGKVAKKNEVDTIRKYVGAILTAQDMGYTLDYFLSNKLGIDHVLATVNGKGERKVVAPAKPTRKNAEAKAYEAIMATKEYKALPARARKAIQLLAKGEAFSTVSL
jgi:hypothetical protein